MSNPFSPMSMLLGCCTDRYLTRIDPNVKDENVSWVNTYQGGNWKLWASTPPVAADVLKTYPSSGYVTVREAPTPYPFFGLCIGSSCYMTGPSKESGKTSELYFRAIAFAEPGVNAGQVASMVNPDGKVTFKVSITGTARNGFLVDVTWLDTKNVERRAQVWQTTLTSPRWLDIKVFIPADRQASVVVTPVQGLDSEVVQKITDFKDGFMDNLGDKLHVFSTEGPKANSEKRIHIHRIGVGNKLTTARP